MRLYRRKIAISVSDAPDRARLGLPAREVDRALFTICTAVVREGGEVLYAGNLSPDQYTFKIFRHLAGAYASGRKCAPFRHVIPEPIARRTNFDELHAALKEASAVAQTRICVRGALLPVRASNQQLLVGDAGAGRQNIANESEWTAWINSYPVTNASQAYTEARAAITAEADAGIALGGKMGLLSEPADRFEGAMPGVVEEAIMMLETGKPLITLGAYGGAARDIAIALGLLEAGRRVPRGQQQPAYSAALTKVASLAGRLPDHIRPALAKIADDDRGEPTAYKILEAIVRWHDASN